MTEYILLKNLTKSSNQVHKSLHIHSNQVYRVQLKLQTETNHIEYIAEEILWAENNIKEVLSLKEAKERYPEYLL